MKNFRQTRFMALPLALIIIITGCGHEEHEGHNHDHDEAHQHDDQGHDHDEASSSNVSFKPGEGVLLTEETRRNLNVQIVDVTERNMPEMIPLVMQVFGEKHRQSPGSLDHTGCDAHGSAFLPDTAAAKVQPGQNVYVLKSDNEPLHGVVLATQKALAIGESEVVIGVSNAANELKPGEFVPARIVLPHNKTVLAVPESAHLQTTEGSFVYKASGNTFSRTAVKTGTQTGGWMEITDGLVVGDQVVTHPVQTLYLIELRATKGGGHSH